MFRWGSITEGMLRQLLSSTRLRIINLQLVNSLTDELFKVENTIIAWFIYFCEFMFDWQDILDRNPLPSLEFLTLEQCHGSWLSFVQIFNQPVQVILIFFKQQRISKTKFNWIFPGWVSVSLNNSSPKLDLSPPFMCGVAQSIKIFFLTPYCVLFNIWIDINFASPV